MPRGDIWTVAGASDYAGKPRPVVVVQDDAFSETSSMTICPFTSDVQDTPLLRIVIAPTTTNGLKIESRIMIDKVTTVQKSKLGTRIGRLSDQDLLRVNRALLVFLGLAS